MSPVRAPSRVVVVLAGALVVAGIVAMFGGDVRAAIECPRKRVAVPPATATPAEVVTAYVAAIDACDETAARALSTPQHGKSVGRAEDSWYRNVKSISNLDIQPATREGVSTSVGAGYPDALFVPVYFDLDLRREASMSDGNTRWGYLLVRESPGARWLVADQGPV